MIYFEGRQVFIREKEIVGIVKCKPICSREIGC